MEKRREFCANSPDWRGLRLALPHQDVAVLAGTVTGVFHGHAPREDLGKRIVEQRIGPLRFHRPHRRNDSR